MSATSLAILTALIWGIVPILEKLGLKDIPPLWGLFFRCCGVVIGLLILGGFLLKDTAIKPINTSPTLYSNNHGDKISKQVDSLPHPYKRIWQSLNIRQIFLLLMSGLLASVVGQVFFYLSLQKGEVSRIVPIAGSYPLISFLLGIFFLGESFNLVKTLAVILIIFGIWLIRL